MPNNHRATSTSRDWFLVDAARLAAKFRYTFYKPSDIAISRLQPGHAAQLLFALRSGQPQKLLTERLWVTIQHIRDGVFYGQLHDTPAHIADLARHDAVRFEPKHIVATSITDPVVSLVDQYRAYCLVTARVLNEGAKVRYLYRQAPYHDSDSGWRLNAGDEDGNYMANTDNIAKVPIGTILSRDDSMVELLEAPVGSLFVWDDATSRFVALSQ